MKASRLSSEREVMLYVIDYRVVHKRDACICLRPSETLERGACARDCVKRL
jgi:hypothetical protein